MKCYFAESTGRPEPQIVFKIETNEDQILAKQFLGPTNSIEKRQGIHLGVHGSGYESGKGLTNFNLGWRADYSRKPKDKKIFDIGRFRLGFAWYDLWIGVYPDLANKRLYIVLLPTILITIKLK